MQPAYNQTPPKISYDFTTKRHAYAEWKKGMSSKEVNGFIKDLDSFKQTFEEKSQNDPGFNLKDPVAFAFEKQKEAGKDTTVAALKTAGIAAAYAIAAPLVVFASWKMALITGIIAFMPPKFVQGISAPVRNLVLLGPAIKSYQEYKHHKEEARHMNRMAFALNGGDISKGTYTKDTLKWAENFRTDRPQKQSGNFFQRMFN